LKALRFAKTGDLGFLELVECPTPKPAEGQVLVRIRAAKLNKSDASNVLGKHSHTTLPRIPGRDFAGVIAEGPAALVGREVWGSSGAFGFTRDGTHAEYLVAGADEIASKPKSLSFSLAATCGVPYTTASSALSRTGVAKGSKVLVVGANGAVGSAAVALARWRGAQVVGAVLAAEEAPVRARGVPAIVLSGENSLAEGIGAHFPGGADVIFDATGFWLPGAVGALARFGRIAVIVAAGDGRVNVPIRDLYRRAGSIIGVNSMFFTAAECARTLEDVGAAFDRGELSPPAAVQERRLEDFAKAYEDVNRAAGGNFVFTMP